LVVADFEAGADMNRAGAKNTDRIRFARRTHCDARLRAPGLAKGRDLGSPSLYDAK